MGRLVCLYLVRWPLGVRAARARSVLAVTVLTNAAEQRWERVKYMSTGQTGLGSGEGGIFTTESDRA